MCCDRKPWAIIWDLRFILQVLCAYVTLCTLFTVYPTYIIHQIPQSTPPMWHIFIRRGFSYASLIPCLISQVLLLVAYQIYQCRDSLQYNNNKASPNMKPKGRDFPSEKIFQKISFISVLHSFFYLLLCCLFLISDYRFSSEVIQARFTLCACDLRFYDFFEERQL